MANSEILGVANLEILGSYYRVFDEAIKTAPNEKIRTKIQKLACQFYLASIVARVHNDRNFGEKIKEIIEEIEKTEEIENEINEIKSINQPAPPE